MTVQFSKTKFSKQLIFFHNGFINKRSLAAQKMQLYL